MTSRSQLPQVLGALGASMPAIVLWPDVPPAKAVSFAIASGLLWGAAGVLLRERQGCHGHLLLTCAVMTALFWNFGDALAMHVLLLILGAAVLVIFAANQRLLGARSGSLIAELEGFLPWFPAAVSMTLVVALANVMDPHPVHTVGAALAAATAVVVALKTRTQRAKIAEAVARVATVDCSETDGTNVLDLGIGEERWVLGPGTSPYRIDANVRRMLGSRAEALRHAAWSRSAAAAALFVTISGLLQVMLWTLASRKPVARIEEMDVITPPQQTDVWYPGHQPVFAELTGDGVEDLVSLRWDGTRGALFLTAHDGQLLVPVWSTDPLPSQWMSPWPRLVHSGSAVFLLDSEGNLHIYHLMTGRRLAPVVAIGPSQQLCAGPGGQVWIQGQDIVVDATGARLLRDESSWCQQNYNEPKHWTVCSDRLDATAFAEHGDDGIGWSQDLVLGFDPDTCTTRWSTAPAFTDEESYARPELRHRLRSGRVFTLYRTDAGHWFVGARSAADGKVLWHLELPRGEGGSNFQDLLVTSQRVYVALDARVDIVDPTTGALIGSI